MSCDYKKTNRINQFICYILNLYLAPTSSKRPLKQNRMRLLQAVFLGAGKLGKRLLKFIFRNVIFHVGLRF